MSTLTIYPTRSAEIEPSLTPGVLEANGAQADDKPQIVFGLTFNLRGQLIPVTASDIANAKKNGITLELPGPVTLGSFNDFRAWFKDQFQIDIPSADSLPPPLSDIIGKLSSLVVTVVAAKISIPGDPPPKDAKKTYTLIMTAEWPASEGGIPLIPGVLTIDGAVFGVTNDPQPQQQPQLPA